MDINKIIAREGLVLTGILIFGAVLFFGGRYYKGRLDNKVYFSVTKETIDTLEATGKHLSDAPDQEFLASIGLTKEQRETITRQWRNDKISSFLFSASVTIGLLLLYTGYPGYLLIRFLAWAVKTLRRKK
jgi:hypothetical protein